jgi:membrane-bound ClpP family serine protease
MYPNQFFFVGLLLAIWYNWTGIKNQMGQTIKWKKVILVIGVIVLIFGGLLLADSVYKVIIAGRMHDELSKGTLFIALLQLVFGTTLLFQVSRTIRSYTW